MTYQEGMPKDPAHTAYTEKHIAQWDTIAQKMDHWTGWGGYYHQRLEDVFKFLIVPGQRVIEIGCAQGDLLAALKPSVGVGVDFSDAMIRRATAKHPDLRFIHADAHDIQLDEKFDVVILSDLVNDLWDVQTVFKRIAKLSTPRTLVIMNFYSRLWEAPLRIGAENGCGETHAGAELAHG